MKPVNFGAKQLILTQVDKDGQAVLPWNPHALRTFREHLFNNHKMYSAPISPDIPHVVVALTKSEEDEFFGRKMAGETMPALINEMQGRVGPQDVLNVQFEIVTDPEQSVAEGPFRIRDWKTVKNALGLSKSKF